MPWEIDECYAICSCCGAAIYEDDDYIIVGEEIYCCEECYYECEGDWYYGF